MDFFDFKQKFQIDTFIVHDTDSWILSVRPEQATLGALVLSLRRDLRSFEGLEEGESAQLGPCIQLAEHYLSRSFQPSKINILGLMMVDPFVHFHIIPRYDRKIRFGDIYWEDSGWPGLPDLAVEAQSREMLQRIKKKLCCI